MPLLQYYNGGGGYTEAVLADQKQKIEIHGAVGLSRIILLTGRPGIGKTTVLLRIVDELKKRNLLVDGFVSREFREHGRRVGFKIISLSDGREGWLAHVRQPTGPRIGKYKVCIEDLESIGVDAIFRAIDMADVVVIDEIGPMELLSRRFRRAVHEAFNSRKVILGTIHYRIRSSFISEFRDKMDIAVIEVTMENRDDLPLRIASEILRVIGQG